MSSSYQNNVFEVLTKTNNSQTFVQITKEKSGPSCLSQDFFQMLFLLRLLGFFWDKVNFFSLGFAIFFQVFAQTPLFFQVFQVWPYFSRFSRCGGNPACCAWNFIFVFFFLFFRLPFQFHDNHTVTFNAASQLVKIYFAVSAQFRKTWSLILSLFAGNALSQREVRITCFAALMLRFTVSELAKRKLSRDFYLLRGTWCANRVFAMGTLSEECKPKLRTIPAASNILLELPLNPKGKSSQSHHQLLFTDCDCCERENVEMTAVPHIKAKN